MYKKTITIAPETITVIGTTDDGGVILKNDSTREIDLGDWTIKSGNAFFEFPKYSFIGKGDELSLSSRVLGFEIKDEKGVILLDPSGSTPTAKE
jgi:hypothetical protein